MNKFALILALAPGLSLAQGALDILDRASRSSTESYGRTLDNAHRRTQMNQIHQENAWFNNCMYQTGGNAARCGGIRQTHIAPPEPPQGTPARLVAEGGQVRTVTGLLATECFYEVNGQQFARAFARCPTTIYVR
jgi:hypothetical protein